MIEDQKFSCTSVLGAEILMVITSFTITIVSLIFAGRESLSGFNSQDTSLFLSMGYALFLPLMSYLFSQAKQYNPEGRAQIILIWMVLMEIIRVVNDNHYTWQLRKSMEQLVRLFWVGYLVYGYAPLHGLRVSLFVLCIYFTVFEIVKGIALNKANDSYLIGKNPKLIHNYVKRVMLEDDLQTIPMNSCDYIVMGEENHEISVCNNGYHLGKKKSNSKGMLTIGRVFQLNSEDEVFTSSFPTWRDNCLSLALAKMLRRRFAKLPVDEAGCKKALDFVLEGLINYIGRNGDIQTNGNNLERKPIDRVFDVIRDELKYVYEMLHTNVLAHHYCILYTMVDFMGFFITLGTGIYLIYSIFKRSFVWLSQGAQDAYSDCFFHIFSRGSMVMKIFSGLDKAITILLVVACIYIHIGRGVFARDRWTILVQIKSYINGLRWTKRSSLFVKPQGDQNVKEDRVLLSVLDLEADTIFFCIKVQVSILTCLPKWIKRNISTPSPIVVHSTDAKEVILESLKKSANRLTNGETYLENNYIKSLKWAGSCNGSTTEAILVWHIATTLFHHLEPTPQQNNDPQQNHNSFQKEREVALALSNYCHYLVKSLPELLPDEVDWTEKIYENVTKEILAIDKCPDQERTKKDRCNYALLDTRGESSVVGKGAKLAKNLMNFAEHGQYVWMMLADFWADMLLFIASSDNVDGHEKNLERLELITQLWAILTHAGIITLPNPIEQEYRESKNNVVPGDMNV